MGFNLNDPSGGSRASYDASAYKGFVFWGRVGTSSAVTQVRFNVPDTNTDPEGGVCTPAAKCSDYLGKNLTFTTTWTEYTVYYTDLMQQGFGSPLETTLAAASIYGCQFQVSTMTTGAAFDVWIDDIYFIPE
jgi:hypothetical protein